MNVFLIVLLILVALLGVYELIMFIRALIKYIKKKKGIDVQEEKKNKIDERRKDTH